MKIEKRFTKTIRIPGDNHRTTDITVTQDGDLVVLRQDVPVGEDNVACQLIQLTVPQQAADLIRALFEITTH